VTALLRDPVLQAALHAGAAALFLFAARHKLRDPDGFRRAVADYEILPRAAAGALARLLPPFEGLLGVACLIPATAGAACLAGAALVGVYGAAIAVNLARGRRAIDCGCGGPGGRRPLSGGLVLRNAALAAFLLLAALPSASRPFQWLDAVTGLGTLAALVLLHAAVDCLVATNARLRAAGGAP
jgi:hypothetical protein